MSASGIIIALDAVSCPVAVAIGEIPMAPNRRPIDAAEGVEHRRAEAGKLRNDADAEGLQHIGADDNGDAGEPDDNAEQPRLRQLFIACEKMRRHDREERRRCIQDRDQAGRNVALSPDQERERHGVVQKAHADERASMTRDPSAS